MVKIKRGLNINKEITFQDDILNRKPYGQSLANLIDNSNNDSLVISINSNWGEWKSYFLHMWKNYLISEKWHKVIYFDAFKSDFLDDPFVALLWEILKSYESDINSLWKIKEKWRNILKSIIPLSWKILARLALWWDIESVDNQIEKAIEGDLAQFISMTLEEYSNKDKSILVFKETLEKIIAEKWKVVFIIDELDRCRPDFAVRLLERIKHFFNIKWLYFVLGINKLQLEKYIINIYWDIDANTYLHKFIDIETILPKSLKKNSIEDHYKNFITKSFADYHDVWNENLESGTQDYVKNLLLDLARPSNLTLRDIEKIINYLALFYKSQWKDRLNLAMTTMFLIFIKLFNPELYKRFKEWRVTKEEISTFLKLDNINDSRYKEYFIKELDFIFDEEIDEDLIHNYNWVHRYNVFSISELHSRKRILEWHFNTLEAYNIN